MAIPEQQHLHEQRHGEKNHRLRQQFGHHSFEHGPVGTRQPLHRTAGFDLMAYTPGRDQHDHQLKQTRDKRIAQIDRIVKPRVVQTVSVYHHRLQHHSGYFLRHTHACKLRLHYAAGCRHRHALECFVGQSTGHEISHIGVICYRGACSVKRIFLEITRDIEKSENLALLNLAHGIVITVEIHGHGHILLRIKRAAHTVRQRRIVQIHDGRRHPFGQSFRQQRHKKQGHADRHQHHGPQIKPAGSELAQITPD